VTSCFEVSIETNLMVQSKFNLILWFVSYNIFFIVYYVGPVLILLSLFPLSQALSCTLSREQRLVTLDLADETCVAYVLPFPVQQTSSGKHRHGR
jgi:hypothetical protein